MTDAAPESQPSDDSVTYSASWEPSVSTDTIPRDWTKCANGTVPPGVVLV